MRIKILMMVPAALLFATGSQAASAAPLVGGVATSLAETIAPIENVHYYGYRGGYYGGYGGYGRGYYGGYGGYGRGY